MPIAVAKIRDVADGTTADQFTVSDRRAITSLTDLDPIYRRLLDEPVTATIGVVGGAGRILLTPVWFDYEDDHVLLNLADHRTKVACLRRTPQATFLLVNPANPYHWISIKATVEREIHEDDPVDGHQATEHINKAFNKYIGPGEYGLRDPSINERRVLFHLKVDSVATFGRP